jgi:hypothetical protein
MITLSGDTGISNISNAVTTGNILDGSKLNPVNAVSGSVIQVVQTVMSNTFFMTGVTFTEVTPLRTAITPLFSNSKILVLLDVKAGMQSYLFRGKLLRNGGGIALGDAAGTRPLGSISLNAYSSGQEAYNVLSGVTQFLDSPATTSPCVYSFQIACHDPSVQAFINRSYYWQDSGDGVSYDSVMTSSMTLMEIRQ